MKPFLLALSIVATPLAAQQTTDPGPQPGATPTTLSGDRVTVGLAGGVGPSYEGSDDYIFRPGGIVQGSISGFEFAARGTNLFVDVVREAPGSKVDFVFGPVAQLRLERTSNIRDLRVSRLGRIKAAFEVGGYAGVGFSGITNPFDKLSFDVAYRRDVSDIHDSFLITPAVSFTTPLSLSTLVNFGVSADYAGRGYGQTYFGVTPAGALASGLSPYTIDRAGWKSAGGNALIYQSLTGDLRRGLAVFAVGGYSELLGQYRRSPLVREAGRPAQYFGFAGLAYTF